MRVRVTGDDAVRRVLARVDPDRRPELVRDLLAELAGRTVDEARRAMVPGSGPPVRDRITRRTGRLARSLVVRVGRGFADVGTPLEYGAVHEFARHGRRAWLRPAAERVAAKGAATLEERMDRELRRA